MMTNLTENKSRTTAHAQALEAAMEFSPGGQEAVADFHERLQTTQAALDAATEANAALQKDYDATVESHDALVAELAAEKEAHATTQAALDAATKTPE